MRGLGAKATVCDCATNYQRLILAVRQDLPYTIFDRVLVGLHESVGRADEDRYGFQEMTQLVLHALRLLLAGFQVLCKSDKPVMSQRWAEVESIRFGPAVVYLVIGRSAPPDWIYSPLR